MTFDQSIKTILLILVIILILGNLALAAPMPTGHIPIIFNSRIANTTNTATNNTNVPVTNTNTNTLANSSTNTLNTASNSASNSGASSNQSQSATGGNATSIGGDGAGNNNSQITTDNECVASIIKGIPCVVPQRTYDPAPGVEVRDGVVYVNGVSTTCDQQQRAGLPKCYTESSPPNPHQADGLVWSGRIIGEDDGN